MGVKAVMNDYVWASEVTNEWVELSWRKWERKVSEWELRSEMSSINQLKILKERYCECVFESRIELEKMGEQKSRSEWMGSKEGIKLNKDCLSFLSIERAQVFV